MGQAFGTDLVRVAFSARPRLFFRYSSAQRKRIPVRLLHARGRGILGSNARLHSMPSFQKRK